MSDNELIKDQVLSSLATNIILIRKHLEQITKLLEEFTESYNRLNKPIIL